MTCSNCARDGTYTNSNKYMSLPLDTVTYILPALKPKQKHTSYSHCKLSLTVCRIHCWLCI